MGVVGVAGISVGEVLSGALVGDVVGVPREPIDGDDRRPQACRHQPGRDREVLVVLDAVYGGCHGRDCRGSGAAVGPATLR